MSQENTPKSPKMFHQAPPKSFEYAFKNRRNPTEAEEVLWNALKGKQLAGYKFRRQHPASRYILDFYCHVAQLAVEVDGGYHLNPEQKLYDAMRTDHLVELGISEIRFTNDEVLNNLQKVLDDILNALRNQLKPENEEPLTAPPSHLP